MQNGDVYIFGVGNYDGTNPTSATRLQDSLGGGSSNDKMDKVNPTGTGSFSLNRKSGTTIGTNSFAEGQSTTASKYCSHAEGCYTEASEEYSHAEGYSTIASGQTSHAEGGSTVASGQTSHAEGHYTTASGAYSHAEGDYTTASGDYSHAEGDYTLTGNDAEHAQGRYNKTHRVSFTFGNAGNTIHSIGIGNSESARKNAVEVMQNGDVYIFGAGAYDGTEITSDTKSLQDLVQVPITTSSLEWGTEVWKTQNWTEMYIPRIIDTTHANEVTVILKATGNSVGFVSDHSEVTISAGEGFSSSVYFYDLVPGNIYEFNLKVLDSGHVGLIKKEWRATT